VITALVFQFTTAPRGAVAMFKRDAPQRGVWQQETGEPAPILVADLRQAPHRIQASRGAAQAGRAVSGRQGQAPRSLQPVMLMR
jgi:hypothetical protein